GRHHDRAEARAGRFEDGGQLVTPLRLQLVRELHDENAVARDEADEGDQTDLTIDIDRGQAEEREDQRAAERERHRAGENDERIAEALELRREDEVDQDAGEQEHAKELGALGAELARLAGIVDRIAARERLAGFVLEVLERIVERDARRESALDADGVELLEAFEIARLGRRLQRREGRQRHELPAAAGDVDLRELVGRQPVGALYERDDLV